jgi:hypothetical protein
MMSCMVCKTGMDWKKAHYECPRCHWIKPCCEPDMECVISDA